MKNLNYINNIEFHNTIFTTTILILHVIYFAFFLGIRYIDEKYISFLSTFIQLGVCIFLIIRFFPLYKIRKLTKLDVSIIFYCATFLLMNVVLVEISNLFPQTQKYYPLTIKNKIFQ
jgi:magnesium-transporting ATPase (P-type)